MVIAFLVNPTSSFAESDARQVEAAARALGQHVEVIKASTEQEVEAAFATLVDLRADTLLVDPDPFFNSQRPVRCSMGPKFFPPPWGSLPAARPARPPAL